MDRPFMNPTAGPSEEALAGALGAAHPRFVRILDLASTFAREWNFTKGSGWILKVHDGKKTLLYLIPLHGGFRISMAIREAERDALLGRGAPAAVHDKLSSARKYSEGFALQFDVDGATDFGPVESFIAELIAARR